MAKKRGQIAYRWFKQKRDRVLQKSKSRIKTVDGSYNQTIEIKERQQSCQQKEELLRPNEGDEKASDLCKNSQRS